MDELKARIASMSDRVIILIANDSGLKWSEEAIDIARKEALQRFGHIPDVGADSEGENEDRYVSVRNIEDQDSELHSIATCQSCGDIKPTRRVHFLQNIGMLFSRHQKSIEGHLCKQCIHKYFWEYTIITLFVGWWGLISFFVTPFILFGNVIQYLMCISLKRE